MKCNWAGIVFNDFPFDYSCCYIIIHMISIDYLTLVTQITMLDLRKNHFIDFWAASYHLSRLKYYDLLLFNPPWNSYKNKKIAAH